MGWANPGPIHSLSSLPNSLSLFLLSLFSLSPPLLSLLPSLSLSLSLLSLSLSSLSLSFSPLLSLLSSPLLPPSLSFSFLSLLPLSLSLYFSLLLSPLFSFFLSLFSLLPLSLSLSSSFFSHATSPSLSLSLSLFSLSLSLSLFSLSLSLLSSSPPSSPAWHCARRGGGAVALLVGPPAAFPYPSLFSPPGPPAGHPPSPHWSRPRGSLTLRPLAAACRWQWHEWGGTASLPLPATLPPFSPFGLAGRRAFASWEPPHATPSLSSSLSSTTGGLDSSAMVMATAE